MFMCEEYCFCMFLSIQNQNIAHRVRCVARTLCACNAFMSTHMCCYSQFLGL